MEVPVKNEVDAYLERPKRYENVDGTGEIFFGLMFLGFAVAECLEGLLTTGSPRWMHLVALNAAMIPAFGLGLWLRRFVKKHWTWRRTGYVAYRRGAGWWVALTASLLIAATASLVLGLVEHHAGANLSRIGEWAVYPAVYALWVLFAGREHLWKWLVLLVMVLGLAVFGLRVHGDFARVGWQLLLFFGLVWIGSGLGTLFSYIRHTQVPESEAQ